MKKRLFILVTAMVIVTFLTHAALAFPFFFNSGPKPNYDCTAFGVIIGPSHVNDPGARYSPIQGASVKMSGPNGLYTATSNNEGAYKFEKVKAGEYNLSASKDGFAPYMTKISLEKTEVKRVPNITLVPGVGFTTVDGGVIGPDTVYVALAYIETKKYEKPLSFARKGAILEGADPFTIDGNTPFDPSRNFNPYDRGNPISGFQNSLMTIDPQNVEDIKYVKLDGRPTWMTFNIAGTKLYVATDNNFVLVYDILSNNILIGSVPLPAPATDLALSSNGKWLFISYGGSGGIAVVDTKSQMMISQMPVPPMADGTPGMPMAIAASRDGSKVYVALASAGSGEVVCIDSYSRQLIGRTPTGSLPVGMKLSPDEKYIYVANHNSASISVITTSPFSLVTNVPIGVSPTKVAVSPDSRTVYVTCKGSNYVAVLSSMGMVKTRIPVGKEPMGIAITGDGARLFIANNGEGTVSVIDTTNNFLLKTTRPQPHSRPYGVAVKP